MADRVTKMKDFLINLSEFEQGEGQDSVIIRAAIACGIEQLQQYLDEGSVEVSVVPYKTPELIYKSINTVKNEQDAIVKTHCKTAHITPLNAAERNAATSSFTEAVELYSKRTGDESGAMAVVHEFTDRCLVFTADDMKEVSGKPYIQQLIPLVKKLRDRADIGLREAKDFTERFLKSKGIVRPI